MNEKFEAALKTFLAGAQAKVDKHHERYEHVKAPVLTVDKGRRYLRIVSQDSAQRSVYVFIDTTSGDILKAASWKKPAPNGVRGNIFSPDNGLGCVDWHGAIYIR
jgi:hypothetical protein